MQYNNFPLDIKQYRFLDLIGCGATSKVYKAICIPNNQVLSIKKIDLELYPLEIDVLRQEVSFWSSSLSDGIVKYYGSFINGSVLYILMEFLAGGSFYDLIKHSFQNGFRDETVLATILKGILNALVYVHNNKQVHRDIKPGNVLLGQDGTIKIGDFGITASLMEQGKKRARFTVIGTPCYMAPEILEEKGYTEKADIWSLGITAIELATGVNPYNNLPPLRVTLQILNAPPPRLPMNSGFSKEFQNFIRICLDHTTENRPSAKDLLNHPFIAKAKDKEILYNEIILKVPPLEKRAADNIALQYEEKNEHISQSPLTSSPHWNFDTDTDDNKNKNINEPQKNEQVEKLGRFRIRRDSHELPSNLKQNKVSISIPEQPEVSVSKPNLQNSQNVPSFSSTPEKNNNNQSYDELSKKVDILTEKVNKLTQENEQIKKQIKALLLALQKIQH